MKKKGWGRAVWKLLTEEPPRSVTRVSDRTYVQCQEVVPERRALFEEALRAEVTKLAGVSGVSLEPVLGQVRVHSSHAIPSATLREAVEIAEERAFGPHPGPRTERRLPGDESLELQRLVEAVADGVSVLSGLGFGVVSLVPQAIGTNVLGLLFIAEHTPLVREALEQRFGPRRSELLYNLATAAAQAVSQRPLASLVDFSHKVASLRELRERRALWERLSEHLTGEGEHLLRPVDPPPARPGPMPMGPIEKHVERAWYLAAAAATVNLATTRNPSRAVAALFAALPRPAHLGRELFATELARLLSRRGTLVLSQDALQRMDRIDCLVLPADLMAGERFAVGELFGARKAQRPELEEAARTLFSPEHPLQVQQDGRWALGPLRLLPAVCDSGMQQKAEQRAQKGSLVLGISDNGKVRGLVDIRVTAQRGAEEIVKLARRNGMRVVLASDDVTTVEGKHVHDVVPAGEELVHAIRRLQHEGHAVAYASRSADAALAAADLGIALQGASTPTAWHAHVLCADDMGELSALIKACTTARSVSEQSVQLAMGATALGTVVSAGTKAGYASRRVMFVVNAASLMSMFNALRRSSDIGQRAARWNDPTPWHALDADGVLARLGSRREGLPPADLSGGAQGTTVSASGQLLAAIRDELVNPLAPLLAAGAGLSAAVGSLGDAGMVAGVGGINALVGGYQRFRAERAIRQLTERAETRCRVRSAGKIVECRSDQLRRGDIVVLGPGDLVPADCRVLTAESLEVDASSLTGESLPVLKSPAPSYAETVADRSSMLYAGTTVASGRCDAVVVAIGSQTLAERGLGGVEAPDVSRGGVEKRLRDLMALTGPVAVAAGGALVLGGMLRGRRVDDLVQTGVSLAVAAVPEGLPLLATAAQLSAAERLSRAGAPVRNARAVEALGRIDVICLDKTGTLTEGRIALERIHDGVEATHVDTLDGDALDILRTALCAVYGHAEDTALDPTDEALLEAGDKAGLPRTTPGNYTRVAEQAFESARGYHAVLGRLDGEQTVFIKGAPEAVLPRCSKYRPAGSEEPIYGAQRRLLDEVAKLAKQGLRVLAIARGAADGTHDLSSASGQRAALKDAGDLTLLGLLAFRDPVRPSAQAAIDGLARAGIRVVMLTGDHPSTAETIAREVGLLRGQSVVSGARLSQLTDTELESLLSQASVYARVTPAQKVRIVRALQRAGHTVAMAGDGANDAPALRLSDVGIAVGAQSTQAARAASDLVLADARIDRIVDAVVEGRAMWISVREAVSILVGGNLGEIGFTVAVGGLTGRPPLSPRQLLLVNFLTDVAPAMAIALRKPSINHLAELAHEGPEASLGAPLDRGILARALVTSASAASAWTLGRVTGTGARARTIGLASLVGTQLGQTLRAGRFQRPVVLTGLGSLAVLIGIVQTPGLSHVFGCRPLGPFGWGIALGTATAGTVTSAAVDNALAWISDYLRDDDELDLGPVVAPHVGTTTVRPPGLSAASLDPALRRLHN